MMRRRVVIPALILTAVGAFPQLAIAQFSDPKPPVNAPVADASTRFTAVQLDNLAGPVALYPDALLAQVLVAATFPDQVQDAADFVRANGTDSIDVQSWDISVKAVAHYPSALNAMADKIDWTSALGKAYATQSSDVMASVQRLRRMAADQGNLNSTPQQKIVTTNETVQIVPVETRVIYVPVYDPYVIYSRPIFNVGFSSRYWSWGIGFPIGSWLVYDCDWGLRRVYYNGWSPSYYAFGGGWRQRSRPFIQITNIYVSPRYANVYVNRNVATHSINYYNVDRNVSVHSGNHFDTRHDGRYDPRDDGRNGTRYAVRNDGNNGGGASNNGGSANNGGGYRSGNSTTGNDRSNTPRDGSGYGTNSSANGRGNSNANGNNRTGNGNRGGNDGSARDGNGTRGGNDGSVRDGNGNRVGNTNARPPEQRRSEPGVSPGAQVIMPQRRAEPQQPQSEQPQRQVQQSPRVFIPQQRTGAGSGQMSAPEQRRAEPRQAEQHQPSAPQVVPQQRRSEPAQRVEAPRQAPPSQVIKVAPPSSTSSGDARTAKRRGGN